MARLSIALATYNGAQYLLEQLASLAAQDRLPDEIVVCDDCSTDSTVEILERFAATAPFKVRICRNEANLGFSANFSKAAGLCRGDIIFLCDQDDVWHPQKLRRVAAEFDADPEIMVVLNDARLVDEKLRPSGRTQYGNIRSARAPDNYFNTGCCSAHRRVWQWLTLPVPEWIGYHDVWINFFAHETGHARILPIALQDYRRHGLNVTNWILSDPAGATALQLFRVHGLKDARDGWRLTDRILEEMQQRLNSVDASSSPLPQSLLKRARKRIAAHRQALDHRTALCSSPRFRRPLRLLRLWRAGGYRYFQGWKSALKDLIRP